MDYYLQLEDLGRLTAVVGERIGAEGVPTCDEVRCDRPAAAIFEDGLLFCTRHAEERADAMAANDMR